MPPVTVTHIESDGDGGWLIEWHDAANLDGLPLNGITHLTEDLCVELALHQRKPNKAPTAKLAACHVLIRSGTAQEVKAAFEDAYNEILSDRIDRHTLGLKAITRHGHEDLEAVRAGAPVRPWNARKDTTVKDFAAKRRQQRRKGKPQPE